MRIELRLRESSQELLRQAVGEGAEFRPGQLEAIEGLVARGSRLLVVQATGWGKSFVYFIATKILRDGGALRARKIRETEPPEEEDEERVPAGSVFVPARTQLRRTFHTVL